MGGIYALCEPSEPHAVRYIGQAKNIVARYVSHISGGSGGKAIKQWVAHLRETDLLPRLEVIEECADERLGDREKYWIGLYNKRGAMPLLNKMPGGGCLRGYNKTWGERRQQQSLNGRTKYPCAVCGKPAWSGLCRRCRGELGNGRIPPWMEYLASEERKRRYRVGLRAEKNAKDIWPLKVGAIWPCDMIGEHGSDAMDKEREIERGTFLREIFNILVPREARILQLRYGLLDGEGYTMNEVARKFGISQQRTRQIEGDALKRLRGSIHRGGAAIEE